MPERARHRILHFKVYVPKTAKSLVAVALLNVRENFVVFRYILSVYPTHQHGARSEYQ